MMNGLMVDPGAAAEQEQEQELELDDGWMDKLQ